MRSKLEVREKQTNRVEDFRSPFQRCSAPGHAAAPGNIRMLIFRIQAVRAVPSVGMTRGLRPAPRTRGGCFLLHFFYYLAPGGCGYPAEHTAGREGKGCWRAHYPKTGDWRQTPGRQW